MEKAELRFDPALDMVGPYVLETCTEALNSFTIESLDLFSALIPSVAIWTREAKPSEPLSSRVRAFSTSSIDVYAARLREPFISNNPFSEKKTLICPEDIDDLSLKRTLFALEGHEEMTQRVMHISALIFVGCIATFGSAPLLAACAYAPLYCIANAYSLDTAFLEAFPEEKEALVKKRTQELQPPAAFPTTIEEYGSNTLFYVGVYLSAVLKKDIVEDCEVFVEPVPEPKPEPAPESKPPAEEVQEPTPESPKEIVTDAKDPKKRGGHRGR